MERPKRLREILEDLVERDPRTVAELRMAIRRLDRHHEQRQAHLERTLAHQRDQIETLRALLDERGMDQDAIDEVLEPLHARFARAEAERAARTAPVPTVRAEDAVAQEIEHRRLRGP